jgi:catechol 2,3-dioxygenase-like lactoylglutathione lyase family enzyme
MPMKDALCTPSVGSMASELLAVTFDSQDPARVAAFWADMLGRDVVETNEGAHLPGDGTQVGLGFARCRTQKVGPNRVHLHLTSTSDADQQHSVDKALGLGARHLDIGQRPEEGHVVLADPDNNEFCVIEANNSFLAGCGFLGELACDGGREVGLFWSQALGWPLVWDQDQETAIQSPRGGTKAAWGGPSATPVTTVRQRFDVTCTDRDKRSEIERLISLGATPLDDSTMADPGGNEFRLLELDD